MDVLNPVKKNCNTVNSKAKNHAVPDSSAAAARTRLERLGIGDSIRTELVDQHPLGNATVESEPIRWRDYRGTCDIQLEKSSETNNSNTASSTGGIDTHRAESVKPENRSQSADYISNFHAYAISLFSVLVLSAWIFGYFILR